MEQSGLLKGVTQRTTNIFGQNASKRHFRKGQMVSIQGEKADSFYIIIRGWVKLFRETLDGAEAVIDVLTQGHIFGETALFEDGHYSHHAEAVEDSDIICLPLSLLTQTIKQDPQLALNMLTTLSRSRKQRDMELEHRTIQNAPQRIGCFLLRLCKPNMPEPIHLHLPYDKTLIASRLGMKPETFSRALSKLRSATHIRIKGATVEIDNLELLSNYSCSACSSVFPCADIESQPTEKRDFSSH